MIHRILLEPAVVSVETGGNNANPIVTNTPITDKPSLTPSNKPLAAPANKAEFKIDSSLFPDVKGETSKVEPVAPVKQPNTDLVSQPVKAPIKPVEPAVVQEPPKKVSLTDGPISVKGKTEATPFDYTGFTETQVQRLKQMSNESREFAVSVIKENRELSKLKGAEYLQHPQAYLLSPEFKELQDNVYYANKEALHWEQQLENIKAGREWRNISADHNGQLRFDAAGNLVLGTPQKPEGAIEERVRDAMYKCKRTAEGMEQQAQALQTNHAQRVTQDTTAIQQHRAAAFGWVADPKGLEQVVDIGGGKEKSVKQIREDFLGMIPSYMRDTLGFQLAADCFAGIQIYGQAIRALESENKVANIKVEEVRRAEPSSSNRPSSPGSNGKKEFSMEGFNL